MPPRIRRSSSGFSPPAAGRSIPGWLALERRWRDLVGPRFLEGYPVHDTGAWKQRASLPTHRGKDRWSGKSHQPRLLLACARSVVYLTILAHYFLCNRCLAGCFLFSILPHAASNHITTSPQQPQKECIAHTPERKPPPPNHHHFRRPFEVPERQMRRGLGPTQRVGEFCALLVFWVRRPAHVHPSYLPYFYLPGRDFV